MARGCLGGTASLQAHAALLHVDPFEPVLDVELLPGDILYIPPGFPHDGVSLEPSMSFSVGFRAKSACHMLSGLADYLIDQELGNDLLTDPKRPIHHNQGYIDATDFARIRAPHADGARQRHVDGRLCRQFPLKTKCALDLPGGRWTSHWMRKRCWPNWRAAAGTYRGLRCFT